MDLLDRLAAHAMLSVAPREELEWLIAHSELRRYERGAIVAHKAAVATEMIALLSGRLAVHFSHGTGRQHVIEVRAGTVSGVLPFSRIATSLGDVVAEETTEALVMHRDQLPGLIRECPTITSTLVHSMVDRARAFTATDWQDEKMVSIGRLAAGLAHELNNPASAATRSAQRLGGALTELGDAAEEMGRACLTHAQRAQAASLLRRWQAAAEGSRPQPVERSDREDQIVSWFEAHDAEPFAAALLAESGIPVKALDEASEVLPPAALKATLRWLAAACMAQSLAADVEHATRRISGLVQAVKRFTNLDRAAVPEPTDLSLGLADTVALLAASAREKAVVVRLDMAPGLPLVPATAADLNQVWFNLIENAIEAARQSGEVIVNASLDAGVVTVRIIDDGNGVPPELLGKIFDPFFTTKGVGEGFGVGLDIARRIVRMHEGQIAVTSSPGRTEFSVRLPV